MNYPNIAIVSYNILWQLMEKSNSNSFVDYFLNSDRKTMKDNMLKNIVKVSDYYNPQIYCFQEASNYQTIYKLFDSKIFSHHVNKSGPEFMLTVWNKERFKIDKKFDGEFESGRPFCIFIFTDNLTENKFTLINLHAGHRSNTLVSIFEPIQKVINTNIDKFDSIQRIIIAGDFNRNINEEIIEHDFSLKTKNKIFNFNPYTKKMSNTCCDTTGNNLKRNFDHVIDSMYKPLIKHELNKESWYLYPSSDHVMIMSILKKY